MPNLTQREGTEGDSKRDQLKSYGHEELTVKGGPDQKE